MFRSPSRLPEDARARIADTLNASLADGLDLQLQVKVAHWNLKGPRFPGLHPLFDTFATGLTVHNDTIAERVVTLGGRAYGTANHVAKSSRLPVYPPETARDVDHALLLAERFESYLQGVQTARTVAGEHADADTVDLLTRVVTECEKNAWMLRASLEG
jgi:starvation-inducible DNA-binding protein